MWLLLMLVTSSLASPALWADEADSGELVGTRWAEKDDGEGEQPKQEGWRALRGGEVTKVEDEEEVTQAEEQEQEDVANQFKRHQLPALGVLESRAAKDPSESKKKELIEVDDPEVKQETRPEHVEKDSQVSVAGKDEEVGNLTRQLEVVAFPVGVAIGAIGAAIWPSVFPERTTTTTTAASAVVGDLDGEEDGGRDPTTTTTTTSRFFILSLIHCCSAKTKIQKLSL